MSLRPGGAFVVVRGNNRNRPLGSVLPTVACGKRILLVATGQFLKTNEMKSYEKNVIYYQRLKNVKAWIVLHLLERWE